MSALFTVEVSGSRAGPLVSLSGELDMATVEELRDALDQLIAAGATSTVVDCRRLHFCDAAGLSALLAAAGRLPGGLSLRDPPHVLRRVRALLDLEPLLPDAPAD